MTENGISQVLAILATAYGVKFSDQQVAVWHELLGPIADDDGRGATLMLCRTSPYSPKPADIWRAVMGSSGNSDAGALLLEDGEAAIRFLEAHLRDDAAVDMGAELNQVVRDFGGPTEVARQIQEGEWRFRRAEAVRAWMRYRREGIPHLLPERPEELRDHAIQVAEFPTRDIPGLPSPRETNRAKRLTDGANGALLEPLSPEIAARGLQMIREKPPSAVESISTLPSDETAGPERPKESEADLVLVPGNRR